MKRASIVSLLSACLVVCGCAQRTLPGPDRTEEHAAAPRGFGTKQKSEVIGAERSSGDVEGPPRLTIARRGFGESAR